MEFKTKTETTFDLKIPGPFNVVPVKIVELPNGHQAHIFAEKVKLPTNDDDSFTWVDGWFGRVVTKDGHASQMRTVRTCVAREVGDWLVTVTKELTENPR